MNVIKLDDSKVLGASTTGLKAGIPKPTGDIKPANK